MKDGTIFSIKTYEVECALCDNNEVHGHSKLTKKLFEKYLREKGWRNVTGYGWVCRGCISEGLTL